MLSTPPDHEWVTGNPGYVKHLQCNTMIDKRYASCGAKAQVSGVWSVVNPPEQENQACSRCLAHAAIIAIA